MSRFLRIVKLGARSLMLHGLRSFLTALGIIIGVGTVIYMLAVITGRAEETQRAIRARGATNIIIKAVKPSEDGNSGQSMSRMVTYGLTFEDAKAIQESMPNLNVIVRVRDVNEAIYRGNRRADTVTKATMPNYLDVARAELARGRWFTDVEMRAATPVAILGAALSRQLFDYHDPIGDTIRVGSKIFRVIGVLEPTVTSDEKEGTTRDRAAYIPLSTVRERFGERNIKRSSGNMEIEQVDLHSILVQVKEMKDVIPTSAALESLLASTHKKNDYEIDVPLKLLAEAKEAEARDKRLFGAIAAISLLVGGIGIMNIMLASVTERTREIGVRRALGAKRRFITLQFLIETLILSVLGGIVGILCGYGATLLHERFVPEDPETIITAASVILSFGISALVGILAGLYPAVRAAHMDPIEALRHE